MPITVPTVANQLPLSALQPYPLWAMLGYSLQRQDNGWTRDNR